MDVIPKEFCINDTNTTSPFASQKKKTSPPGIPRDLHLDIRGLNYCKTQLPHTTNTNVINTIFDWFHGRPPTMQSQVDILVHGQGPYSDLFERIDNPPKIPTGYVGTGAPNEENPYVTHFLQLKESLCKEYHRKYYAGFDINSSSIKIGNKKIVHLLMVEVFYIAPIWFNQM